MIVTAIANKILRQRLSAFGKGQQAPEGYSFSFDKGEYPSKKFSESGKFLGIERMYDYPAYIFKRKGEDSVSFCIEPRDEKILVFGESNCKAVSSWEEAISIGISYKKEGL
jgi:hypothetical protein